MRWLDLVGYGVTLRVGAAQGRSPILFLSRGADPIGPILKGAGFQRTPTGFWMQPFTFERCAEALRTLERMLEGARPQQLDEKQVVVPVPPEMFADDPHDICLDVDWIATTGAAEAAAVAGFGLPDDCSYLVAKLSRGSDREALDGLRGRLITLAGEEMRTLRVFATGQTTECFGDEEGVLLVGVADFAPGPAFFPAAVLEEAAA